MWVARDKDGQLRLFKYKPFKPDFKHSYMWNANVKAGLIEDISFRLDNRLFPNLRWEDEPIEVELVSKKFMDVWREKNKAELSLKEE